MKNDQITSLRKEIDEIDRQIAVLLVKRLTVAKKIGEMKKKNRGEKTDNKREQEVFENIKKNVSDELVSSIQTIYQTIISVSKKMQL